TYREPDLKVTSLVIPESAASGQAIPVSFTIANLGTRATREGAWVDRVFLSRDPSLDNKDLELGSVSHTGALAVGDAYTSSLNVTMPEGIAGPFYLLIYADSAAYRDPQGNEKSDIGFGLPGVLFEKLNPLIPWDLASESSRSLGRGRVPEYQDEGNNIT